MTKITSQDKKRRPLQLCFDRHTAKASELIEQPVGCQKPVTNRPLPVHFSTWVPHYARLGVRRMYIGAGPEDGKVVESENAFSYACERCLSGKDGEKDIFLELARNAENMEEFAGELVEWFYSGNWIEVEVKNADVI